MLMLTRMLVSMRRAYELQPMFPIYFLDMEISARRNLTTLNGSPHMDSSSLN